MGETSRQTQIGAVSATWQRWFGAVIATWIVTVVLLPVIAAAISVGLFLRNPVSARWTNPNPGAGSALMWGLISGLLFTLLIAVICHKYATAERANSGSFSEFRTRLSRLHAQIGCDTSVVSADAVMHADAARREAARREACEQLRCIHQELNQNGLPWVTGTGYISLWEHLHGAEEALIEFQPRETVTAGAAYDALRLAGSNIPQRDDLLKKVRQAVAAIDPSALKYLSEPVPASPPNGNAGLETLARATLRTVRLAIDEFRDENWNTLVRARNHLAGVLFHTGLLGYMLVAIAIWYVPQPWIAAAVVFYLVGAIIGLLSRLYSESQENATVAGLDGYGLASLRVLSMPVVSGLAAVFGVILVANSKGAVNPSSFAHFDNLSRHIDYLVIAAVFGLTPSLLFNQLQRRAETLKKDLATSEAHQ